MLQSNLRGELTSRNSDARIVEWNLVDAVSNALNVSFTKDKNAIAHILYPALTISAVMEGDIAKLKALKLYVSMSMIFNHMKLE